MSKYGLVNDEVRKRVWPLLLNVNFLNEENLDQSTDFSNSESNKELLNKVNV